MSSYGQQHPSGGGIDRMKLRLAVLGILVVASFVALFSRLWFLQVLASEEYERFAQENRVRLIYSEPSRGRILDREGRVLVRNRGSNSVTIDKQVIDTPAEERRTFRRLSRIIDVPFKELEERFNDTAVSPYKPVAVAYDVSEKDAVYIDARRTDFPGVVTQVLPVREYPYGDLAAHILGFVGEISPEELKDPRFKDARPRYEAGDLIGKEGVEYFYDRFLRGTPRIDKVIVNSNGDPVASSKVQDDEPGKDLMLSIDLDIQKVTENALSAGLRAARAANFTAPAGAVVVMDPQTGGIVAIASNPDYDPATLADGLTEKEYDTLGAGTRENPDDDALFNRATQLTKSPGSTFKVVTAGAALATGVADTSTQIDCPGSEVFPPEGGPGSVLFRNWTSASQGLMGFPESLEVSCNTFYYTLGWRLEEAFGAGNGDGSERFQRYARQAGLGRETGIDLRNEADGVVPDQKWLTELCKAIGPGCNEEWLPGYSVNMAIGQGDMIVTPLQMAVTYGAIASGGNVVRPRLGWELQTPLEDGGVETERSFRPSVTTELPLEDAEVDIIRQGLEDVVMGDQGTAVSAFAGFPLERFPIAGKTGTAQIGSTDRNDAWFISYGPSGSARYVVSVIVQDAGHGGTSAAPIARQIWEGIFEVDKNTDVRLSVDNSG